MNIQIQPTLPETYSQLILPFTKGNIDLEAIQRLSGINQAPDFEGKLGEVQVLYKTDAPVKLFLLGLGEADESPQASQAFRSLAFHHHEKWGKELHIDLRHLEPRLALEAVLGIKLATYRLGSFKTEEKAVPPFLKSEIELVLIHADALAHPLATEGLATAETQLHMMELVNRPSNLKTPTYLADYAFKSGHQYGYEVSVLNKGELETAGLHALLAVGKGSEHPPVMIQLEYKPEASTNSAPRLGLVGKGITFDTGGLSIKSANNMHYMKSDMGGAAAVLGTIELAAKLQLPIHLVGIVPAAENSVDAGSFRPGDVIQSYSGKSIEVIDTDAEGRLVLADGLAYIQKHHQPETVIDLATLTGSCVATLGYAAAGLFSHNDELAKELEMAGKRVHERVWRLPLFKDYEADIHSDIADVRNYSGKPIAGAATAATFLEYFIKGHPRWAHLDIAGVAFGDSEYSKMKAATGFGVRLLISYCQYMISQRTT